MELDRSRLLGMYRQMLEIRQFEEKALELYKAGRIPGTIHPYVGEEAIAVGVCSALRADDYITSTHRGHGHCLAKGGEMKRMMAELMAKETGYCRGKGGSMHVAAMELGMLGANGVVGGGMTIALGAGLSARVRGTDQVAVSFFGDGASNQGVFHEAVNMAAIWKLGVIFVCENNQYAISTPVTYSTSVPDISMRAAGYSIPGVTVDGNDVLQVYEATERAVARGRAGEGPTLIEAKTYRWYGHSIWDALGYRPQEEEQAWKERDPIKLYRRVLEERRLLNANEARLLEQQVVEEVQAAVEFAEASPSPKLESLLTDVYA